MKFNNYIDGDWVRPLTEEFAANISPVDHSELDEFPLSGKEDVDKATRAAAKAFLSWKKLSYQQRGDYLLKAASILSNRLDEVAEDLTKEEGKTIQEARGEVQRAISTFQYYANEANQPIGEVLSSRNPNMTIYTKRVPLGPVGLITPWNFPIAIPAWKMAPALIYGNTIIIKPASNTPKSTFHLVQALHDAGIPSGVVNCVFGSGGKLGDLIIKDTYVKAISFTGSDRVGHAIRDKASVLGKPVQLELGGKNPLVILKDADLDLAVTSTINDAFLSAGQKCTATSRVIVESEIFEAFQEKLVAKTKDLVIGDPMQSDTFSGPLASSNQLKDVSSMIEKGKLEGKLLLGDSSPEESNVLEGYYIKPAIFLLESQEVTIAKEEIFGPVISLIKARDFEEALTMANDTEYGLSAGVFTNNMALATRFIDEIEAGMVHINSGTVFTELHAPFGGMKNSSYGPREQGKAAIEFYTKTKTIYSNVNV